MITGKNLVLLAAFGITVFTLTLLLLFKRRG